MQEYPGNSHRAANKPTPEIAADATEPVKVEPIVTGKVIRRKKSFGRRIKELVFSSETESLPEYLIGEVLVPAFKSLLIDFVTTGVQRAVGEVHGARRPRQYGGHYSAPRTQAYTSYDRYAGSRPAASREDPQRRPSRRSSIDVGDFVVPDRIQADNIMDQLAADVEHYGGVSVAQLLGYLNEPSVYTDAKWGWTNLDHMRARKVPEGYLLMMPPAEEL
jgi:hypothetical protein